MSKVTVKDPLEILDSEHEVAQSPEAITIRKDDRDREIRATEVSVPIYEFKQDAKGYHAMYTCLHSLNQEIQLDH